MWFECVTKVPLTWKQKASGEKKLAISYIFVIVNNPMALPKLSLSLHLNTFWLPYHIFGSVPQDPYFKMLLQFPKTR